MLIDEIAKEMELEQFVNHLEKDIGSVVSFVHDGQSYSCPSQIGLIDIGYIENDCGIGCNACWLRAIKDVKFKDNYRKFRENKNISSKYKIEKFSIHDNIIDIKINLNDTDDIDKVIKSIKTLLK